MNNITNDDQISNILTRIIETLDGKKTSTGWKVRCPAHDDTDPSLSISIKNGKLLVHCFGGCLQDAVIRELRDRGLWYCSENATTSPAKNALNELQGKRKIEVRPAVTYVYEDENGNLAIRVNRFEPPNEKKYCTQEYFDGRVWASGGEKNLKVPLTPYRFREWKDTVEAVFVVEGEKCADFLSSKGLRATTSIGGASNWKDRLAEFFKGRDVIILPDNDEQGRKYASNVLRSVGPVAKSVKLIELSGLDVSEDIVDWALKGGTKEKLLQIIDSAEAVYKNGQQVDTNLLCMADVELEAIDWVWHPYIPRGYVTFVEGDPGIGKSFLTLALATALSKGDALYGMPAGRKGRVLIFNAEDGISDTLKVRLNRLEADQTNIFSYKYPPSLDEEGRKVFENAIAFVKPEIVFLDPLSAFLGSEVDMYKPNHVRPFMKYLSEIASSNQCAIVIVRHLTKAGKDQAIYRGTGSIDFVGAARSSLLVGCDAEDQSNCAMVHIKSNCGPKGDALGYMVQDGVFRWTGKSDLTAERILSSARLNEDEKSSLEEAADFLRNELALGCRPAKEIFNAARDFGISEPTLRRARKTLKIEIFREGVSGGKGAGRSMWRLGDLVDQSPHLLDQNPHCEKLIKLISKSDAAHQPALETGVI